MKDQMSLELNKINLLIVGKPNSGKSTLFNFLCKNELSPTGDEYGLTKKNYSSQLNLGSACIALSSCSAQIDESSLKKGESSFS